MVKNLIVEVYFPSEKYQILSNLSNLVDYISQIISSISTADWTPIQTHFTLLSTNSIKVRFY